VHTWVYVLGFGAVGWMLFKLARRILTNYKQVDDWLGYLVGVAGLAAFVLSGVYATNTWIYGVIGWFKGWEIVALGIFLAVVGTAIYTLFALVPDRYSPEATIGLGLALAWVIVPSALAQGYVPGTVGATISQAVQTVTGPLIANTSGWFG
jgi:hypothetical protein